MEMLPVSFMFFEINNPKFEQPFAILIPRLSKVSHCQNSMSHSKLREDSTCLNCGEKVHARFCSHCGQENKEPHESFWGLLFHFVEDILHYDGKLFASMRTLFARPGFLTNDYLKGRRATYLHPIRFYLFTSAFFFLCLFYVFHPLEKHFEKDKPKTQIKKDTSILNSLSIKMVEDKEANPVSFDAYLAQQAKLPLGKRDSELEQRIIKQFYRLGKEYKTPDELISALLETMLHKISTVLFIALPFLAFILYLLFIRKKNYYFMHHGIFVLHLATSFFLVLFVVELLGILHLATHIEWIGNISAWLIFAWFIYYLICFKNFYQLTWLKGISFYFLTIVLQQVFLIFVFLGLLLFSLLSL
jgi:hypothetical protein